MKRIAIQGVPGSFHDIAAHKFFPNEEIELICCDTFEEIFEHMHQDSNVIGMLENLIVWAKTVNDVLDEYYGKEK